MCSLGLDAEVPTLLGDRQPLISIANTVGIMGDENIWISSASSSVMYC